jgi:hypothetical protein
MPLSSNNLANNFANYILLVLASDGETYGANTDPNTGRSFKCTKGMHYRCGDGVDKQFYVFTNTTDEGVKGTIDHKCIKCNKNLYN